jgi:hypothetical protein
LVNHYYAFVTDFLEFQSPVLFREEGKYLESSLMKADGSTNKGAFGRAVRLLSESEYRPILQLGFVNPTVRQPDLVVDFQQLVTLPREQMTTLERLASLDSPFAEALLARFGRYFGRLGTPDLDLEVIINRLQSAAAGVGSADG